MGVWTGVVVGFGLGIVALNGADASCGVEVGFIALPRTGVNGGVRERVGVDPYVDAGFGMGVGVGTDGSSPSPVPFPPRRWLTS